VQTASLKTYLMAIAKNLWLKRLRAQKSRQNLMKSPSLFLSEEENVLLSNWVDKEKNY
jgi:DNA-directed RNA polymerase specialized sigma24 family protein